MSNHSKLFYIAIARIKATNKKDGVVLVEDLKEKLGITYVEAAQLKDELVAAGILREWDDQDLEGRARTNVHWLELDRY